MARISKQQSSSDEPKKTRRQRRPEMSPEKREFLRNFVGMYDIKTAADLQDAVKDLLGDTIEDMLEEEMNEHLGYEKYKHSDNPDSRNGYKSKEVISSAGSITIDVPQDRDSAFEPKVVKKDITSRLRGAHSKISSAGAVCGGVCRRRISTPSSRR